MFSKGIILICFIFCYAFSFAQNQQNKNHKDTIILKEVIVKEQKPSIETLTQTLDFIAVDKEFMLQNQGNNLMNTLEQLPGVSAINTGVGIAKPVIRGMSFNRVIVAEYGIKQEGQQWGADHGLEIDPFNAEEVEILKGPSSLVYGSDGIGGVINILNPKLKGTNNSKLNFINSFKSNNNAYNSSLSFDKNFTKLWFKSRITYQTYGDYKVPASTFKYNTYTLPIYNQKLKNTAGNENDYSFVIGYKSKQWESLLSSSYINQKAGFFAGAFGIPRSYQLQVDGNDRDIQLPHQNIQHLKIISKTSFRVGTRLFIEPVLGYQLNLRQEKSSPHAHNQNVNPSESTALQFNLKTYTYNIKFQYFISNKWNITVGSNGQYQQNSVSGFEFLIPAYTQNQVGVYALSSLNFKNKNYWLFGVRSDKSSQLISESYAFNSSTLLFEKRNAYLNKKYTTPSFSSGLFVQLIDKVTLKYNISSAFRVPNVAELASNGVHHGTFRHELGDSSLNIEKGILQDIGITYSNKKQSFKFNLTPFYYHFANYIYLRPSAKFSPLADAGQMYNYQQGRVQMFGFETESKINITQNIVFKTNLEYVRNMNLDLNLPLPFTPPLSFFNELKFSKMLNNKKIQSLNLFLNYHTFLSQKRVDRNELTTEGYSLVNAGIDSKLKIKNKSIVFRLQIRNLLNTLYLNNMSRYRILNLPEQGRNFQCMIEYSF